MDMSNAFRSNSLIYRAIEDTEEDKSFLHSLWLDPQSMYLNKYTESFQPMSRKTFDAYDKAKQTNRLISVMICLPVGTDTSGSQAEFIGKPTPIGFVNLHGGMNSDARHHRTHDIGILIAPQYRGHGYGSEAIRWILNWGFQIAGLHRIGLQSAVWNEGAIRLWGRLGFKEDGRDREALWSDGRWWDEVRFSILEGEWRGIVAGEKGENEV